MMRLEPYKARDGWRWRLWRGSRKFAVSGEHFASKGNANRAARALLALLPPGSVRLVDDARH